MTFPPPLSENPAYATVHNIIIYVGNCKDIRSYNSVASGFLHFFLPPHLGPSLLSSWDLLLNASWFMTLDSLSGQLVTYKGYETIHRDVFAVLFILSGLVSHLVVSFFVNL